MLYFKVVANKFQHTFQLSGVKDLRVAPLLCYICSQPSNILGLLSSFIFIMQGFKDLNLVEILKTGLSQNRTQVKPLTSPDAGSSKAENFPFSLFQYNIYLPS